MHVILYLHKVTFIISLIKL